MIKKTNKSVQSLQIPKLILYTAKLLEAISAKWVTRFAAKLFTSPIKYKIPKREWHMHAYSDKQKIWIPSILKKFKSTIMVQFQKKYFWDMVSLVEGHN